MTMLRIGDLSQHFISLRHGVALRSALAKQTEQLASGRHSDLPRALGAAQARHTQAAFRLGEISEYLTSAKTAARFASAQQLGFEQINGARELLSARLIDPATTQAPGQISGHAAAAKAAFADVTAALNAATGGRYTFGGTSVSQPPLIGADAHLLALTATLAGGGVADSIEAAVNTWFGAGGGFETTALQGDDQPVTFPLDGHTMIRLPAGAAHGAIRNVLSGLALAAVAGDQTIPLDDATRQDLLQRAGRGLHRAAGPLVDLMATVGQSQFRIEVTTERLTAEQIELSRHHNDATLIEMESTATRIQLLQVQLETHYTLVNRLSRLSLATLS